MIRLHSVRVCLLLLMIGSTIMSGCTESTRRVHPAMIDSPAYSSDNSDTDETRKTPKEMTAAGFAYLAAGNATLARMHFVSALKRDAENDWAYVGLGDISYQIGDYPSALANYQKAAALDENNLAAILGQAQALRQQGKLNAAREKIEQAKKLAPDDARMLTEQAINYDLQGQEKLAAPLYQEIAARIPDQAAAFNNIGINKMSQGHYAEAISAFSKASVLDGKEVRISNNLAMALTLYGMQDEALKLFSKTVGEAAAWNNLGYIYMTQERFDEAEKALKKALELNPKFYERAQENLDRLDQLRINKAREKVAPAPEIAPAKPEPIAPPPHSD